MNPIPELRAIRERIDRTTSVYMTEDWDGSTVAFSLAELRRASEEVENAYVRLVGANALTSGFQHSLVRAFETVLDGIERSRVEWTKPVLEETTDPNAAQFILDGELEPSAAEVSERRFLLGEGSVR